MFCFHLLNAVHWILVFQLIFQPIVTTLPQPRKTLAQSIQIPSASRTEAGQKPFLADSAGSASAQQFHPLDSPTRSALANLSRLPLSFIPNAGQTNPAARFLVKSLGGTLFFTPTGVVLLLPNPKNVLNPDAPGGRETRLDRLPASAVWIQYLDSNLGAQLTGADPLPGEVNYLMGNNPKKWMTHLPTYAGVDYHEL
ncbi:MAG: DUF7948 domain-containing protein, partial [Bellilinea sp.]